MEKDADPGGFWLAALEDVAVDVAAEVLEEAVELERAPPHPAITSETIAAARPAVDAEPVTAGNARFTRACHIAQPCCDQRKRNAGARHPRISVPLRVELRMEAGAWLATLDDRCSSGSAHEPSQCNPLSGLSRPSEEQGAVNRRMPATSTPAPAPRLRPRASRPSLRIADRSAPRQLRIAMLAPPWIPVPPAGYGGVERVVDLLCRALAKRGHEVTLFAAPGSHSTACLETPLDAAHPDAIGSALYESDHAAQAFARIELATDSGDGFDVLHDHSGFAALAMADRLSVPVVHTLHGVLTGDMGRFYQRHGHKAQLVAISHSQARSVPAGVRAPDVVPNPLAVEGWPLRSDKADYLLWVGRMDPVKGAHRAIEVARLASRPLILAGPVQPGQEQYFREQIEPHLGTGRVHYAGEVSGTEKQLLFANASALLMPIRWPEPFGLVMVEALACGTPVIAFPEGAAAEIVIDGRNGMLVEDEAEMAGATRRIDLIRPRVCRASVAERYAPSVAAAGYERSYRRAIGVSGFHRMPDRARAVAGRDYPNQSRTGEES